MLKQFFWVALTTVFFLLQLHVNSASAIELSENTRTIPLNELGETITLSSKEVTKGQQMFIQQCAQCHLYGKTKTNNNVSLGLQDLANAEPPRDNLLALVNYLNNPTSYDGEDDYSELHPNVSRPDVFPELRNFTEEDIFDVAGYLLIAPKLYSEWGGTIYF